MWIRLRVNWGIILWLRQKDCKYNIINYKKLEYINENILSKDFNHGSIWGVALKMRKIYREQFKIR